MSWICPLCGTENYRMPLNSRHTPECTGCAEDYITPDELEAQIKPQIEAFEDDLESARHLMQEARDHISSLRYEMYFVGCRDKRDEQQVGASNGGGTVDARTQ